MRCACSLSFLSQFNTQLMRLLLPTFLVYCFAVTAQNVKQDLIVCHTEGGMSFTQKIVAYHFVNGAYTGRDVLLNVDGKKDGKDYIRTDQGINQLYKQRYLVTGIGNIIDLQAKKVLFDGRAHLVRVANDSAIYYTNDAFKGKFYSYFDFKTGRYSEITKLTFKALLGRDVEYDKSAKPFKLMYNPKGKVKVLLTNDAGYGQQGLPDTKYVPDPPKYWLNDSIFIYAKFNQAGTQVSFEKVSIEKALVESVGTVTIGTAVREGYFERIDKDVLMFCVAGQQIQISLSTNKVLAADKSIAVNGFSYSFKSDSKGKSIYYNGSEIGKISFDSETFKAGTGMVACLKMLMVGTDMYQQGLQVWSATSKTWQKIEGEEVTAVVGWVTLKQGVGPGCRARVFCNQIHCKI